jgi:hypothetical protein
MKQLNRNLFMLLSLVGQYFDRGRTAPNAAHLRVKPRGGPLRGAPEVRGHDADGQAAAVHLAGPGAGAEVGADDEGRHRERHVGLAGAAGCPAIQTKRPLVCLMPS